MARVYHDDTIAARATPLGEGALAVIRVSGTNAIAVINSIFKGKSDIAEAAGYTAHFGKLVDPGGNHIDDVIATVFRKPHSYTGEDLVEISCHGGIYISQLVIDSIVSAGARQAEPGEFTKRAFLNGKMDLSQAEAVADLISSRSESSRRISLSQLEGKFSKKISEIRTGLLDVCSLLELELDFSEEGIDLIPRTDVIERIGTLQLELKEMVSSYSTGKICRDGLSVVIIGKPNAGKSSIFNSLLAERRAIVTDIPGTTRDSLEESISIGGVLVRLHDTAGLRETTDPVEQEGVARARSALTTADVVLLVVDLVSDKGREEALRFLDSVGEFERVLIAYNKIDITNAGRISAEKFNHRKSRVDEVLVSARTGEGMDAVREMLLGAVASGRIEADSVQLVNSRHRDAMVQAINSLESVSDSLKKGLSGDFAAMDIRRASDALAEIVGEISTEEMLNSIFSRFCIGK